MKRRLINLLTALSLLLCAVALALWLRSYRRSDAVAAAWRADQAGYDLVTRTAHVYSGRGGLMAAAWAVRWRGNVSSVASSVGNLSVRRWSEDDPEAPWAPPTFREKRPVFFNFLGFGFARREIVDNQLGPDSGRYPSSWHSGYSVWVQHWAVAALAAVLPGRAGVARLRRRRRGAGGCPNCGYDLRATPDKCPECGRAVATSSST